MPVIPGIDYFYVLYLVLPFPARKCDINRVVDRIFLAYLKNYVTAGRKRVYGPHDDILTRFRRVICRRN